MSERSLAGQLAGFMATMTFDRLPDDVVASVSQRVLDTIGICVAACELDTSRMISQFVLDQGGAAQAVAIGLASPVPATWAALVNGTLAHSLDYDDTHLPSVLHPSATIIPACIAAAEQVGATGRQLIAAIAVGLEACVRLGMAGYDAEGRSSTYFDKGQHATSICGSVAGAGAVATLIGLDATGIMNAMAVAASMASGIIEANRTGGNVKRLHCGWAAHAAVSAGQLAQLGFTGPPTVLEGRFGLFTALLDGKFEAGAISDGLGGQWAVPGIHFKPYPANHFTHAAIDAALALRARGLEVADVASLTLGVAQAPLRTIGEPIDLKRRPDTGYQAQFSGPYAVAAALFGGHGLGVGLDDFTDDLARDPARRRLMAKVAVVADDRCNEIFPSQFPAVLTATTTSGQTLTERVDVNRGGPQRPLSDDELAVKFRDNATRCLGADDVERIEKAVGTLIDRQNVRGLLPPGGTTSMRESTPKSQHQLRNPCEPAELTRRAWPAG